ISDGESFDDDPVGAARRAAEEGIVVNTIGLGTRQGAPIPIRMGGRMMGFKKDREGQTVIAKLDPATLMRIAQAGGGEFVEATAGHTGVEAMVRKLRGMDQSSLGTYTFAGHEDRYQYFLAIACAMLVAGLLTGERKLSVSWIKFMPWNA
ncbi:MAG TPA: BatB protein, partial [Flavobacteriales bacterium]|nr:BatB protein [Flavobacteriales bacterium]